MYDSKNCISKVKQTIATTSCTKNVNPSDKFFLDPSAKINYFVNVNSSSATSPIPSPIPTPNPSPTAPGSNFFKKVWANNAVNCESPPSYVSIYYNNNITPCFTRTCACSEGYCYSTNSCSSESISEIRKEFGTKNYVSLGKSFLIFVIVILC